MTTKNVWFLLLWGLSFVLVYYMGAPATTLVGTAIGVLSGGLSSWANLSQSREAVSRSRMEMLRRLTLGILYALIIYVVVVVVFEHWKELPRRIAENGRSEVVLGIFWIAVPVALGCTFIVSLLTDRRHSR